MLEYSEELGFFGVGPRQRRVVLVFTVMVHEAPVTFLTLFSTS